MLHMSCMFMMSYSYVCFSASFQLDSAFLYECKASKPSPVLSASGTWSTRPPSGPHQHPGPSLQASARGPRSIDMDPWFTDVGQCRRRPRTPHPPLYPPPWASQCVANKGTAEAWRLELHSKLEDLDKKGDNKGILPALERLMIEDLDNKEIPPDEQQLKLEELEEAFRHTDQQLQLEDNKGSTSDQQPQPEDAQPKRARRDPPGIYVMQAYGMLGII